MINLLGMSRKSWLLAAGAVLIAAGAAWGLSAQFGRPKDTSGLPPELSRESLKAQAADPQKLRETMQSMWQRTDLTDEQRHEAMDRMRELWQAQMQQRLNEYFTASAAEKQDVLDRHIAEMQKEMAEREKWRQEHPREPNQVRDPNRPQRPNFANMTQQDRKARSESRSPDDQARHMAYFAALQARMAERGIQMPRGPMGGGGPGRGLRGP